MEKSHYIYGIHAVEALIKQHPEQVEALFLQSDNNNPRLNEISTLALQQKIQQRKCPKQDMAELIASQNHQGVIAQVTPIRTLTDAELEFFLDGLEQDPFLLILDSVQDPHNLGACLRSANAAGVHAVIVPKDKAASITATVRKVASGAAEHTPVYQVTNLARTLEKLKDRGIWLFGTAGEAETSVYDAKFQGSLAIVMGAEDKGLRRLSREACDHLIKIPMQGSVSSLNVSVATGICLFEVLRQKV